MSRNGTEVAESVHRLTNGVSNFYLIEENGKLVLVDAGAPKDWARLTRAVTALGRRVADLDAVILTHAHSDHTGFAERARTTAGAQVWVPAPDSDMATTGKVGPRDGKTTAYLLRPAFYRTLWILALGGATKIIPVREVSTFGDGETLDVPGEQDIRRDPCQVVQRAHRLSGIAVQPGRHDLRAEPAGQRIMGDKRVAGEQGAPGFEEQRGAARGVAGRMHRTRTAGHIERLAVVERRHLPDRDDLRGAAQRQDP